MDPCVCAVVEKDTWWNVDTQKKLIRRTQICFCLDMANVRAYKKMKRLGPFPAMSLWTGSAMRQEMRQETWRTL